MAFNFKIFVRALGAIIYGAILVHSTLTIVELFGLIVPTIIFAITMFAFYSYLYCYKFQQKYMEAYFDLINVDQEDFKKIKLGLLAFNVILCLYARYIDPQPMSCQLVALTIFENLCIAFPEIVLWLLEKLFKTK